MSKVLGIIAEYNPFHNGHLHHLQTSQSLINADYTVAIISGNFTQRGSTSIVDKWSKTKMALNNGIDLVIELPVLYSISSAENFADGAIKILNSLGIIDYLSFGAETTDINSLRTIADILRTEPPEYKNILSTELDKGLSFPKAREKALLEYTSSLNNKLYFKNILSSPNNILGIEYLKALKKYNSTIKPLCIKRINAEYNSKNFSNNFGSATAIRELIKNNDYNTIKQLTPECTYSILADNLQNGSIVPEINIFEKEIIYNLRKMSIEQIANIPDVSEGLEFSIKKAANSCNNIKEFLDITKSKRYTLTRLQRILLYVLLDISKEDIRLSKKIDTPYIRILGFTENGKRLVSEIASKNSSLPLITSVKKFIDTNTDSNLNTMLKKDILATNIYTLGYKKFSLSNLDFKKRIEEV